MSTICVSMQIWKRVGAGCPLIRWMWWSRLSGCWATLHPDTTLTAGSTPVRINRTPRMTHDTDPTSHDHRLDHHLTHGQDHAQGDETPTGRVGVIKEIFAPHSHDASDSIDGPLESSAAGIRAV